MDDQTQPEQAATSSPPPRPGQPHGAGIKAHPAAAIFPLMSDADLAELAEDIRKNGQRVPIVILDGLILDGRNRYAACLKVGARPVFETRTSRPTPLDKLRDKMEGAASRDVSGADLVNYVVSMNLRRRHLSPEQRAAVAVELEGVYAAEAKERQRAAGPAAAAKRGRTVSDDPSLTVPKRQGPAGRAMTKAATAVGAGIKAAEALKAVRRDAPEVFALAKDGKVNVAQARRLAQETPKDRAKAVAEIKAGGKPAAVLKGPPRPFDTGLAMLAFRDYIKREFTRWPNEDRRAFIHQLRQLAGELERKVNPDGGAPLPGE